MWRPVIEGLASDIRIVREQWTLVDLVDAHLICEDRARAVAMAAKG